MHFSNLHEVKQWPVVPGRAPPQAPASSVQPTSSGLGTASSFPTTRNGQLCSVACTPGPAGQSLPPPVPYSARAEDLELFKWFLKNQKEDV